MGKVLSRVLTQVLAIVLVALTSPAIASQVTYYHTDALGSVVMESNEAGQVVYQREYRPYGESTLDPPKDGPAYTGHVQDTATGLTYMQQRYYDPAIGRFLSVDPVTADGSTGANSNRYWYANNNPYKFTDPDGRQSAADRFSDAYAADPASFDAFEPFAIQVTATALAVTPVVGPLLALSFRQAADDFASSSVPRTGPKGVVEGRHNANVTVRDSNGNIVSHHREVSGNMTAAEKQLGFPRNSLATHTEVRATQTPVPPGGSTTITGQRAPCPSCRGVMNQSAKRTGTQIRYQWRKDGMTQKWETKKP